MYVHVCIWIMLCGACITSKCTFTIYFMSYNYVCSFVWVVPGL